jgi:hypothetical protein
VARPHGMRAAGARGTDITSTAVVGEGVEADGKTVEVVRIVITDAGRLAIR